MTSPLRDDAAVVAGVMPRLMRHLFALEDDDPAAKLSVAQLRVCTLLAEGPLAMSAIGRELGMSLSAMTQIADRLQRAGYVRRTRDHEDRRVRVLQLTPRAEEVMRERRERHVARVMELLQQLPKETRADLVRGLEMLDAALPTPGEDPSYQADQARAPGSREMPEGRR